MKIAKKVNRYFMVPGVLLGSLFLGAMVLLIAAPCLAAGADYYADFEGWFISHTQSNTVIEMQFYASNIGGSPAASLPTLEADMSVFSGQNIRVCGRGETAIPPVGENSKVPVATFWNSYPDPPGSHMHDYAKRLWRPNLKAEEEVYGKFGNSTHVAYHLVGRVMEQGIPPATQDVDPNNNLSEKDGTLPGGGRPSCGPIPPPPFPGRLGSR